MSVTKPQPPTKQPANDEVIRPVMLKLVKRYREYGYRDYATQAPLGTSLPITYNKGVPYTYMQNATRTNPNFSPEAVKLVNMCTLAYFDAYSYHTLGATWH